MKLFGHIKHHFVPGPDNEYRPRILHRSWLVFFFVVILATEGFLVSNLIARQTNQNFLAAVVPAEIIALTNTERVSNHVATLTDDALLDRAAQAKANDMAASGYFSHTGPDGKTPWQWISAAGYQYQYAGENLAVRFIDSADVVNAWMQSPTHRANMVKPVYTEIGVGVAQGMYDGQSATFVVQYFAAPLDTVTVVAPDQTPTSALPPAPSVNKTVTVSKKVATPEAPTSAPVATTESGTVAGVSVTAAPAPASQAGSSFSSFTQSVLRQVARAFAEPERVSNWVLGMTAAILIIAIALTFFVHIQVQPTQMLMGGLFVALFAVSLLGINSRLTGGGDTPRASQAAGVIESSTLGGVLIDNSAAAVGYALFPQL